VTPSDQTRAPRLNQTIRFIAAVTIAGVLAPVHAIAQQPAPPEPPPRLEASAQLAFLSTTGNSSSQALGLGADVVWRPMPWVVKAKAAFAQTETEDVLSARSTVAGFRADRFVSARTSFFGQYDYLRDQFAGVEQRHTIAGGIAYRLIDNAVHRLSIDGGAGYEHEGRTIGESTNFAIATGGVAYRWEISATSRFAEDLRYVQGFDPIENWKLDQSAALTVSIASAFSLKLSNVVRFANLPVPGAESTDTITSVALVWAIKRPQP
jgi:putative salt-induced outer membrane protein